MSFGYLGDTSTKVKQKVKNQGVISVSENYELEKQGFLGGKLELIQSQTASGSGLNMDFTNIKETEYKTHLLIITGLFFSAANKLPRFRFTNDGGSTFEAANYSFAYKQGAAGTFSENKNNGQAQIDLMPNVGTELTETGSAYVYMYNLGNASVFSSINMHTVSMDNAGSTHNFTWGCGMYEVAEAVNGFRIFESTTTGNITGQFDLYGVKQV
tara:strand:+ start:10 stop:648 length:639 start_codon:yes stop_codon:yes gene_type:complete